MGGLAALLALWLSWPAAGVDVPVASPAERLPGGDATNRRAPGRDAFSEPSTTLRHEDRPAFFLGNGLFHKSWAPEEGLGPRFNADACHGCHRRDGRGSADRGSPALVLRLAVAGAGGVAAEPTYGLQLQTRATAGHRPEGVLEVTYETVPIVLAAGTTVTLRKPRYRVTSLAEGPLDARVLKGPRIAPPMIGVGLLEAVAASDIRERADPDDLDGDGISGRAAQVQSPTRGRWMLGRFGWKAVEATVDDQVLAAFRRDMGLTGSPGIASRARNGAPELTRETLESVAFYSRHLAVPARRGADDAVVLRGRTLFHRSGCAACHAPALHTRADWPDAALANQVIWPYTDLLLHDMGDGLADGRPEGDASGREWRTPPLWGVGLTETVNGHYHLLHDGRARGVLEAILWHGGEARAARDAVRMMSAADRDALVAFVESL